MTMKNRTNARDTTGDNAFEDKGCLLTLIGSDTSDLILRPTAEGIEEAKSFLATRATRQRGILDDLCEMLDWHICNGWSYVQPVEIGALTDATIISRDCERDDMGALVHVGRVFAHMSYMLEDPIATWATGHDVIFQGAST
jgi:hypothetical protein